MTWSSAFSTARWRRRRHPVQPAIEGKDVDVDAEAVDDVGLDLEPGPVVADLREREHVVRLLRTRPQGDACRRVRPGKPAQRASKSGRGQHQVDVVVPGDVALVAYGAQQRAGAEVVAQAVRVAVRR